MVRKKTRARKRKGMQPVVNPGKRLLRRYAKRRGAVRSKQKGVPKASRQQEGVKRKKIKQVIQVAKGVGGRGGETRAGPGSSG